MYLGIDVGGTKTLVASLDDRGVIQEKFRFPTPKLYSDFLGQLAAGVEKLSTKKFHAAGVGIPAMEIDREHGIGVQFTNLPWRNVSVQDDVRHLLHCPVVLENDAKLGALSEAHLEKQRSRVLYVTLGTGIGVALVIDRTIDQGLSDAGGSDMLLERNGKFETWESFASGRAIFERFGKKASEIEDDKAWESIAYDIALGLLDLVALVDPDIVVIGGGIGTHYAKYKRHLNTFLHAHEKENPLLVIPPIKAAERPEEAVVYGCYDLARSVYGKAITVA